MVARIQGQEPIRAEDNDVEAIKQLGQFLEQMNDSGTSGCPQFIAPNGQAMEIPAPIYKVLGQVVPVLAQGEAVAIVALHAELTTQEAADYLNVSRPFLIKQLEEGVIPFSKVGTHRRVRFSDLLTYKQRRSEGRKTLFAHMTALAEEHGEYN